MNRSDSPTNQPHVDTDPAQPTATPSREHREPLEPRGSRDSRLRLLSRIFALTGLWGFLKDYAKTKEGKVSFLLFVIVLLGNAAGVEAALWLNAWNGRFFDALAAVDRAKIVEELVTFVGIVSVVILVLVATSYVQDRLVIKVRRELTERMIARWLSDASAHYRLSLQGTEPDNPDQRILEDTGDFAALSINLLMSAYKSLLTLIGFSAILWSLSTPLVVGEWTIPGYMLWACVLYTVLGTWLTHLIGRPLKRLNVEAQHREADLRFAFIEKRRHGDAVAGAKGEAFERWKLTAGLHHLTDLLIRRAKKSRDLDLFTVGLGQITHLTPLVLGLPSLFAGTIALGGLMQLRGAFADVARALSWVILSYDQLAHFAAVCARLNGLLTALEAADREAAEKAEGRKSAETAQGLRARVAVAIPDGRVLRADVSGAPGETVFLTGPSGTGKSTFLRTVAGFGEADGELSVDPSLAWVPQAPYLFVGTLRENLLYGADAGEAGDQRLWDLLDAFGLSGLKGRLLDVCDWRTRLSGGEAQRVVLIRAVLGSPKVLLLDEATSALDPALADAVLRTLEAELPDTLILAVTHQTFPTGADESSGSTESDLRRPGRSGHPARTRRTVRLESESAVPV